MPSNNLEWLLVFIGLGFALGSTVATALGVMSSLKHSSSSHGMRRIAGLILLSAYAITGLYLLPLVFHVARMNVDSMVMNETGFAVSGLLTLAVVVWSFKRLKS